MKERLISFIAAASITVCGLNFSVLAAQEQKCTVYVAANGDDSADGTINKPLKTLDGARQKVSILKEKHSGEIEVIFRGGEYRFSETVSFTAKDSGTTESQIVYRAYDNEKVEFKGSVELDTAAGQKVADKAILSRMYESVRDKVLCFDLTQMGISRSMIRQHSNTFSEKRLANGEVNVLYVNNSQQMLAQWPNGEGKYSRWESTANAKTMLYHETEPNRWEEAKNFWLGGYPSYDYLSWRASVTDIDTKEKSLTISGEKFTSYQSRRWKAFNLLEEIDIPGEYYIDPDTMLMYFYPPYSLENVKFELSWLNTPLVSFKDTKNVKFEGITFCQTRGSAAELTDVDNTDFVNCIFENVHYRGIYVTGSE